MADSHARHTIGQPGNRPFRIILALAVAWLGLWVHELYRVPSMFGLTPDASLPLLAIAVVLLVWWLRARHKRAPSIALLTYGLINCAGGFLSVLPLPFLPFVPEQDIDHYLVHVVYALGQVPLIITTLVALSTSSRLAGAVTARLPIDAADSTGG